MQIVNFLASLWGIVLVFVPLSLLINPKQIKGLFTKIEDEASTYFCGIIAFTLGTATILLNNVWAKDWKVIVTLIGWVAILKGLCAMFCTDKFVKMRASIKDKEWLSYAILAILFLGLVCVYFGFIGK